MKLTKLLLWCSASYAAMTACAHADPISLTLGSSIFSALYAAGVPGAIANFIAVNGLAAAAVGATVAASIFSRPQGAAVNPQEAKSNFETGSSSVMEGIGRVRVGGLKAFGNTDGSTRARLICRLQGPIDGIEARFVGGREVTVEANGDISSPPWARNGGSWGKWLDKRGDGTETAWSELIDLFPSLWTADHMVRGIAQSVLLWFNPGLDKPKYLSLYQTGVPETEEILRASLIFDPRDGTQSGTDRSTWKWADNGILVCAHVLRRDPAFSYDHFDWTLIASEANRADTLVPTLTGTEKRSRAWGIWSWESGRAETMQQLLDSVGAEIRLTDEGKIWFQLIDDAFTSEISFTPADGYDILWRSGPEAVDRPNIARVKYYSPERNYDIAELALSSYNDDDTVITGVPWAFVQDEVDRYGPKYLDIELPFCPSSSQAQRIGRRKFALARADTGSITTNMVGLAAWGLLYGTVQLPDLGDVLPARMEAPRCDDDNGSVEIPFTVWPNLAVWNPATDEAPAPDVIPEMGYETDMTTPNAPTAALQVTYPDASKELRVAFSLPAEDFDTVEATFRTYTAGLPDAWQSMAEYPNPPATNMAYVAGDYLGRTIDARVRVFDDDDGTYFSDPLNVVVGANNSACGQPTVIDVDITSGTSGGSSTPATIAITLSAPELRAVAIRFQRDTGSGFVTRAQTNVRPGQPVEFSDSSTAPGTWRFQTLTSNGTAGTPRDYEISIIHVGS